MNEYIPTTYIHRGDKNVRKLIAVGDIHGDPLVLLHVLQTSGQFVSAEPWNTYEETIENASGPIDTFLFDDITWSTDVCISFIFLGDIVDTRRNGSSYYLPTGSEELVIRTMIRLHETNPANIIWVLGNHDIMNTQNTGYEQCHLYTNPHYCDDHMYTTARIAWMRSSIVQLYAVALYVVDYMIFSHGSITTSFLNRYDTLSGNNLIREINTDFIKTVRQGSREPRISHHDSPDWCRTGTNKHNAVDTAALHRLGVSTSFVGHTIHPVMSYRTSGDPIKEFGDTSSPVLSNTMYFTDIGMSRAFDTVDHIRPRRYTYAYMEKTNDVWKIKQCKNSIKRKS